MVCSLFQLKQLEITGNLFNFNSKQICSFRLVAIDEALKRSNCVQLICSVVEVDLWLCVCEMWNVAREVQERAEGFADIRTGFRQEMRGMWGMCMLEQFLSEWQVNLGCFLTLVRCYFAFRSFVATATSACVLPLVQVFSISAFLSHFWLTRCVLRLGFSGNH